MGTNQAQKLIQMWNHSEDYNNYYKHNYVHLMLGFSTE